MTRLLPALLTLASALPLLSASLSLVAGGPFHPTVAVVMLVTYSAVVLSFLGGIQWGIALGIADRAPQSATRLFVLSALPPLLAWGIFWLEGPKSQLAAALALFALVWMIDALLGVQKLIPRWFFHLRSLATALVVLSLTAALFALHR